MHKNSINSKKILETINEVGGENYKDVNQTSAAERMLAVEILTLQLRAETKASKISSFTVGNQILEVANNPDLKQYMMVCFWDHGGITAGWGGKESLDYLQLSFGLNVLENRCKKEMFCDGDES